MKNYVIGHTNPDTDSVVSAIAYAELKKSTNKEDGFIAAVAGDLNKETKYLLNRFGYDIPGTLPGEEKQVVLVDHNEPSQRHDNVKNTDIIAVFDHHKFGDLNTERPITVVAYPFGSTATVLSQVAFEKGYQIDKPLASLLVGAIISDTLNLTSPTTTDTDKEILSRLNDIAGIDVDTLAKEMFEAKSDISDISSEDLIGKDYKIFEMCRKRVGIGVWETVLPETIIERKVEILELLAKRKVDDALDFIFFGVVDIVNNKSDLLIIGDEEKELAEAVFGGVANESVLECPGVVSRKKQVVPPIEQYLGKQ